MYLLRSLALTSVAFVFGIFGIANIAIMTVFAEPTVDVSPTCGPHEPGFSIVINANGFLPNSTVDYKFVNSDSKIPSYGYFATNSTGGFNEVIFAELKNGNYKLYFADDANNDNVFDIGAKKIYANLIIPCPS